MLATHPSWLDESRERHNDARPVQNSSQAREDWRTAAGAVTNRRPTRHLGLDWPTWPDTGKLERACACARQVAAGYDSI